MRVAPRVSLRSPDAGCPVIRSIALACVRCRPGRHPSRDLPSPDPADVRRRALVIAPAMPCGPHGGTRCPCHHRTLCRRPAPAPGDGPSSSCAPALPRSPWRPSSPSRSSPDQRPWRPASSCTGWTSQTRAPADHPRPAHPDRSRPEGALPPLRGRGHGLRRVARAPAHGHAGSRRRGRPSSTPGTTPCAGTTGPATGSASRCYDVRDDTMDQLYRPERANPTIDQQRAVDATWALTLRKFGRFFLTGYRAGVSSQCAADANGWKLYARSVEACARQGWTRQRLQRTYLGPNLSFVWSDRLGPLLAQPDMVLKRGSRLPDSPVTVSWKPMPVSPGVSRYMLQRRVGRGDWTGLPLGSPTGRQTRVWLKTGLVNHFRVRGVDDQGRVGPWYYSDEPDRRPAGSGRHPAGRRRHGGSGRPQHQVGAGALHWQLGRTRGRDRSRDGPGARLREWQARRHRRPASRGRAASASSCGR